MAILITGGAGFIGSHTCVVFLEAGLDIVVVDNFHNSHAESMRRVQQLTGRSFSVVEADITDPGAMRRIFSEHSIDAVIHFAGWKAVGESSRMPLAYYHNNVAGTVTLCSVMQEFGCHTLVFSSSATVYGIPERIPLDENCHTSAINPYGRSKLMVEEILRDLHQSQPDLWRIALLRYFNPIGAHPSGQIGEDPNDVPNNLLPFIAQVASGKRERVSVFGNDYDTRDGTGVRDYIHVMDLAEGHLKAFEYLRSGAGVIDAFNLGTGKGFSVLEIIDKFHKISGRPVPYQIAPRRPGDIATCYADVRKANEILRWQCHYELEEMIEHAWNWQRQNPNGYQPT